MTQRVPSVCPSGVRSGRRRRPDSGIGGHEGVGGEAVVCSGVVDLEELGAREGVGTERVRAGCLDAPDTVVAGEVLTIDVDQADEGDRCVADVGSEGGDVVETGIGFTVEDAVR